MSVSTTLAKFGLTKAFNHLYKDPEANLLEAMDWADKFSNGGFANQRAAIRKAISDPSDPYYPYVRHILNDVDPEIVKTLIVNFFINGNLVGGPIQEELRQKYNCNIPWTILLDPTSACNLHCTGCWAAEYGNKLNLSYDEIDDIIKQGKEMGVYFYIYTGGEPLVRKDDLIRLCEKHDDCVFMAFTNGTLIDETFADEMLRVKNFVPSISLEGSKEATDSRRGDGVYDKAVKAMKLLREKKLLYGISCCYTSENYDSITSEAYWDMMIEMGAYFVWYFHYMPVGNDASVELMPNPEQRELVYRRIREQRARKPLFAMDFQNDAEFVGGCIAGGKNYLHINANGDLDPCVFIHYSDSNIREKTILEALRSPLFMAYHDGHPFNDNMLRPCPMLENPELLREMVKKTGAKSTDLESPESVDHLCNKCENYAKHWKPKAEELWSAK
ncbi:radical SAM protein [Fenollaria timonensis]|uniref:radical SAM protein n=1 Tax=Fenollaria timonensis TaxID=1723384 RepID=UPI00071D5F75|nr:radical SAM protein [Fenollaria timonensis]